MPRESKKARQERATEIHRLLALEYPDAHCALDYRTPFELAVATILSAQCTDVRVNMVTPHLFKKYPTPKALAAAEQSELEEVVRSTGFFRNKAKSLIGMATALVEEHNSEIPRTIKELSALPGIGRKTANVVLGNAFGIDEGVVVDTHVKRLSGRMRLTRETTPEKVERDLMALFPSEVWTMLAHLLIYHGRQVCAARKPRCNQCTVSHLCPSSTV
ncbi:MAG: endonuclease III [Longimicrobiales bacterium]